MAVDYVDRFLFLTSLIVLKTCHSPGSSLNHCE